MIAARSEDGFILRSSRIKANQPVCITASQFAAQQRKQAVQRADTLTIITGSTISTAHIENSESMKHELVQLTPHDEHNQQLEANVHPPDWKNPKPDKPYHLVVIGAGTAGLVTAAGAAGLGARVALIERELMGGDCLNVGCVPSKGVIRAARVAATVRDAEPFGVNVPENVTFDFGKVMERMRRLRTKISPNDSAQRFFGHGHRRVLWSGNVC